MVELLVTIWRGDRSRGGVSEQKCNTNPDKGVFIAHLLSFWDRPIPKKFYWSALYYRRARWPDEYSRASPSYPTYEYSTTYHNGRRTQFSRSIYEWWTRLWLRLWIRVSIRIKRVFRNKLELFGSFFIAFAIFTEKTVYRVFTLKKVSFYVPRTFHWLVKRIFVFKANTWCIWWNFGMEVLRKKYFSRHR